MSPLSLAKNPNFLGLLSANTLLATAFPIQMILGGLTGLMLAPGPALATLPAAMQTLAGLLAAGPISLLMGRLGRRAGFALGAAVTVLGALLATLALYAGDFRLLCAAHFLMGMGWAAYQYFRFAAGESVEARWRPVAISLMLTSGLIAALVGPQVFIAAKDGLAPVPFAGAYLAIAVVSIVGTLPLLAVRLDRPTPMPHDPARSRFAALAVMRRRPVRRAVGIAALSQGVMAFMMVPTPIAMIGCGFAEEAAGDVIRWHLVAMFAPSFVTGFLIKRFGAQGIAVTGLLIIVAAAVFAATGLSALHFYGSLIALGVGWNFGFIGATTMLDAAVPEAEKPAVQGANDTIIALSATIASFAAGLVVAQLGWAFLAMLSAGLIGVCLVSLLRDRKPQKMIEKT